MKNTNSSTSHSNADKKAKRSFEFPKFEEFGKGKRASCFSSLS